MSQHSSRSSPAVSPIPGLPAHQRYLPMPFVEEMEVVQDATPVAAWKESKGKHAGGHPPATPSASVLEQQALAWVRSKMRMTDGTHAATEPRPASAGKTKKRKLAADGNAPTCPFVPVIHSALVAAATSLPAPAQPQLPQPGSLAAAPVDWAAVAGALADRGALLEAADTEAAAAAALPIPERSRGCGAQPLLPAMKESLEPSSSYKGVWRVAAGPRQGLYKAQLSIPGRAGRPKKLDYWATDREAAQCYDRAALEKFGVEHADLNFPATSYGYPTEGNYGLLQPKSLSRRQRSAAPLATRQNAPEYLETPLDPASKSVFIGVRLAKNCRGWLAKIKHKGEKHLIGTYRTDEEAARAWDRTAIWLRGPNTQTNFPISHYLEDENLAARYGIAAQPSRRGSKQQAQDQQQQDAAGLLMPPADLFAAAAAMAAAASAFNEAQGGAALLCAQAAEAEGNAAAAGAGGSGGSDASEGGSRGEETDEDGLASLRQQQQQQQQPTQDQQGASAGAALPPDAAVRWGAAIEGQLQQLEGVEHVLLAAAAGQPGGGSLPQDLARLFAAAGLAFLPPAPTDAKQQQQQGEERE